MEKNESSHAILFEQHKVRRLFDAEAGTWWFSVVDIIQVLTKQSNFQAARNYWKVLRRRLMKEGNESVTECYRLKMPAADGKSYLSDVATVETLLRIIQSVPSPKPEPIKLWLAKVGHGRMQDLADAGLAVVRAKETWQRHSRDEKWVQHRLIGLETRFKLTEYWAKRDIKHGSEIALLTHVIHV